MLRVGTRASLLALTQTRSFVELFRHQEGQTEIQEVLIKTEGDGTQTPLSESKNPGVFVSALREALLSKEVDFIIHSMKDLPAEPHAGIVTACVPEREDPRDALVSQSGVGLELLPENALVGTSSPRRAASIRRARPDLRVSSIRGNVDTRLRKVAEGEYDATILAVAGLNRIGRSSEISEILPLDVFLPAPGQGALSIECRSEDTALAARLGFLTNPNVMLTATAERSVLIGISAGCATAIGASASYREGRLTLSAELAIEQTGEAVLETESVEIAKTDLESARDLGLLVAKRLLQSPIAQRATFK
jgi:hydroxymethylbilane synthase